MLCCVYPFGTKTAIIASADIEFHLISDYTDVKQLNK